MEVIRIRKNVVDKNRGMRMLLIFDIF